MQELKFKITNTEAANIEIVPVSDGVEIIVHYGSEKNYGSNENKPKGKFRFNSASKSPEDIIEEMKEAAREEYNKAGTDKEELKKFVKFYEKKIQEDGWNGAFDFDKLYERWIGKKR